MVIVRKAIEDEIQIKKVSNLLEVIYWLLYTDQ